jgi:hypothetical protein
MKLIAKAIFASHRSPTTTSSTTTTTTTTTVTMDEGGQWRAADAVPHFQEPGFHLTHIKAYIDVGSFLIIESPVNTDGVDCCLLVCRFVKTAINGETMALVCNRFDVLRATGTGANLLSRHMDRE